MINTLINIISLITRLYMFVVVIDVLVSYFLPPYHAVRRVLDQLVDPLLNPIRRVVKPIQMIDFSPLVLILLIQVVESLLVNLLLRLR